MMPSRGLDDLQKNAANLVLAGWPLTRIAAYLEVSRPTIYAWKKLPDWEQYIREQSGEAVDARVHRVRQITDVALEQIEASLIDPEIAPARRAEIAIKWLTLLKENMQVTESEPLKKQLDPEVIANIRSEIYGLAPAPQKKELSEATVRIIEPQVLAIDPELPNGNPKILEPGRDGMIVDEAESL